MTTRESFDGCASAEDAVAALRNSGTKQVRIGIFDLDTVLREKSVGAAKAERLIHDGFSFSDVLYEWDTAEVTYSGGAFGDEPAPIDPASGRCYPFAPDTALFLADFSGRHAAFSPRRLAASQIRRAAEMGYGVRAGFEYEFSLFEESPESLREKDFRDLRSFAVGNRSYSALTPAVEHDFLSGLLEMLETAGIELDSFHTELGPGCLEAPLLAREGLRAPDDAALFKTFAKAHALRHGRMACFMSKWSNDWPGQSGHLHMSLHKLDGGAPALAGEGEDASQSLRWFIGGVLAHLPDLLAMCAHTANAYRRLVPGAWAPTHAGWGLQNRSCALRAIPQPAKDARIEFRVPSADSNPYLAFAACLGAGLTGLEEGIEPPPPTEGDAYLETVDRDRRFPRNLLEAADRLRGSARARTLFGDAFVDWFAATREWEDRVFRGHVSDLDLRRYFEVM